MQPQALSGRGLRGLLIGLLTVTVVSLAWNHWGMERRLRIDTPGAFAVDTSDDREADGGDSVASARREGQRWVMDCRIGIAVQYPFCELRFVLAAEPQGLDLSRYDTMHLQLSARAGDADVPVRIFVRNFNPRYSRVGDPGSLKVHEIAFTPAGYADGLTFPLERIAVASWWVDEHPLPLELSGHEVSNAVTLAVATAGQVSPGPHRITVERIELSGKWVGAGTLGLALVAMWGVAMLAWLLQDLWGLRRHLRHSAVLQASLRRVNDSLAQQAHHDALSGALNRHGLAGALMGGALMGGAPPHEARLFPATLVFIDIDHFKQVNDAMGHAVGDEVIRCLAGLVRQQVQRSDLLVRWGGEEFLLLCQGTSMADAAGVAERLRQAVAGADWPRGLRLTCSFGVAEWRRGQPLDEAVARADAAMYAAKRAGRDRVACDGGAPPPR
ncbi:MAG: GGDEF domain-containing protein [Burkholderiaceae bacterium]